jgi:hypothetical protein
MLKIVQRCTVLFFLLVPQIVLANDVVVQYRILDSSNSGAMAHGQIQVEVQNLTNHELQNVDLRVDSPQTLLLEKEMLQLGAIPAGGLGVVIGRFDLPDSALAEPFIWQVDFDAAGVHSQTIIPGIR